VKSAKESGDYTVQVMHTISVLFKTTPLNYSMHLTSDLVVFSSSVVLLVLQLYQLLERGICMLTAKCLLSIFITTTTDEPRTLVSLVTSSQNVQIYHGDSGARRTPTMMGTGHIHRMAKGILMILNQLFAVQAAKLANARL
jgi:hypothetical protein